MEIKLRLKKEHIDTAVIPAVGLQLCCKFRPCIHQIWIKNLRPNFEIWLFHSDIEAKRTLTSYISRQITLLGFQDMDTELGVVIRWDILAFLWANVNVLNVFSKFPRRHYPWSNMLNMFLNQLRHKCCVWQMPHLNQPKLLPSELIITAICRDRKRNCSVNWKWNSATLQPS